MKWIDRQDVLESAFPSLVAHSQIAVDTEADSLHSYFDKVCLIQISVPGEDVIIDPLARGGGRFHILRVPSSPPPEGRRKTGKRKRNNTP